MKYDYLVVGAGLFGSVFAREAALRGRRVLVVDKCSHIGGNCYTRDVDGIRVHEYGAHIFRTSRRDIWDYVNQFAEFNNFVNSPIANYHGRLYNMPFNMNTFNRIWGVTTPAEAKAKIDEQRREIIGEPSNLEEKAISLVGRDVYEILIREYTEKQWGRPCRDLPASIIRRLPVRFVFDNNYFNDRYQGIPIGGYTPIFEKLLKGCDVRLGVDFLHDRNELSALASRTLFTGPIDAYYNHCFGSLEYRSLRFEHERMDLENWQGVAVVNYTDRETPYTRTIEHKHFEFGAQPFTIVSREYPFEWQQGVEPFYPSHFARFSPEVPQSFKDGADPRLNVNNYDNTIAFTDALLGDIIAELKHRKSPCCLLYLSDHGESVDSERYRDPSDMSLWEIPMIFWANDAYRKEYPECWKIAEDAAEMPLQSDTLFDGLVSLAGVKVNGEYRPFVPKTKRMIMKNTVEYRKGEEK